MSVVWTAEWAVALRRRRLLLFNVLVPAALTAVLLLGNAPPPHAAAVMAVLFALFGVFGSAIPLVRDGASGLLLRWVQAGVSERALLLEKVTAQAVLDLVQLAPSLALVLLAGGVDPVGWTVGAALLGLTLLAGNALGALVGALARSLAEAALFSAVSALLLLHASGVFRTPRPGGPGEAVEAWAPFRLLHEHLLHVFGGSGPAASALPGAASAMGLFALVIALAPALVHRLIRARD